MRWQRIAIPKDPVAQWRARPIRIADLDGDGDTDIVANCEEYHRGQEVLLAVVWFENPRF